jgi:hypothetical protein
MFRALKASFVGTQQSKLDATRIAVSTPHPLVIEKRKNVTEKDED